ncbi:MAG: hypothetical protein J0L92_37825, partial [Deltaproteobacteria bacterium]|nr:hypothetical protein [Deltaproteobacteria bacterium]
MKPTRTQIVLVTAALALAALWAPSRASAQSFYVMVVEFEGVSDQQAAALEAELPGMARRCAGRRLALGQRVALVDLGPGGEVSDVELRSDDVSPSGVETAFGRCMERALRARHYERPLTTPGVIEIAFEYASTVPRAHAPGGEGVRRGPRTD